ncbi:hypothetical protein [Alkalithermobacter paradoxus]|uniref:Uncharacterized protein n=1 Tax=Alkalithermobacter paradoxus TaxID=29349 RepID=A0A1V4I6N7_9FIRM|nr:hypothetical protein CLOTH_13070 [[Clostridium] thermoalcaliphilum]
MIKRRFYQRRIRSIGMRKSSIGRNKGLNKILIQFVISCIIVLLALGVKANFLKSERYIDNIRHVLQHDIDFAQYMNIIQKKTAEVFKLYDEGEFE